MHQSSEKISGGQVPVIEMRHVDKHYGQLHVLKDINLQVHRGEVVVIIGPSGSGKSTLCRTINRMETIDSGEILIEGELLLRVGALSRSQTCSFPPPFRPGSSTSCPQP